MYRLLDHTADVVLEAKGENWREVFEALGKGLFEAMVNVEKVKNVECRNIYVEGDSWEELVVKYLEELIILKDAEGMAFSRYYIEVEPYTVKGKICGEKIRKEHEPHGDVKAVALHGLMVKDEEEKVVRVVLDL